MKKLYQLTNFSSIRIAFVALFIMLSSNQLFADGSRDLYPSGKAGYRAYIRSSTVADTQRWPFPTEGVHYVYADVGERITLASSAQNALNARIRLYYKSGGVETLVVNNATAGVIANRTAELAGPQLFGGAVAGRYTPIYYQVPAGAAGIYRVELVARGGGDPGTSILANSNWTQGNDAGIFAWDISVINAANTAFIPGRVYSNVLCLTNGIATPDVVSWRGIVYTLTNDGFTYRVTNDNNGLWYTFFVNNNGFIGAGGFPIYKSLDKTNLSATEVQNPRAANTATQTTHKMFYTVPSLDLPVSASGAVPGDTTWLRVVPLNPEATALSVDGVEGTGGQVSIKGGYIKFNSNIDGKYNIKIISGILPAAFTTRTLTGFVNAGANSILWDGKDGSGNALPTGLDIADITVRIQGAEVHFPYIDMEYNKGGTTIELLDQANYPNPTTGATAGIVYWDDSDLANVTNPNTAVLYGRSSNPKNNSQLPPTNSTGIDSKINGHRWGVDATGTAGQFGDQRSIDTWSFITGPTTTVTANILIKISDLKISQLTSSQPYAKPGDAITFTVKAKNDGPSDAGGAKFKFTLPPGFDPQSVVFTANGCGTQATAISYDAGTRTYSSTLDLPNGCEITYTFSVLVTNAYVPGAQNFKATILRPNDVTDPDATNDDITIPPTDAQFECTNNGQGGICNNILSLNLFSQIAFPACTTTMYLSQYPAVGGTSLYTLDNVTNPLTITQIGSVTGANVKLNGIGFNPVDNFIYGINSTDRHLYRVDSENTAVDMGVVAGLGSGEFISGDIDDLGRYYVKANNGTLGGNDLFRINLATKVATLINLSIPIKTADFAYNFKDGFLYGVGVDSERLIRINPVTGAVTNSPQLTGVSGVFGAMYTDGVTGAVYGNNNNANFYIFNKTTGRATKISSSISSQGNDGAHCVTAAIEFGADLSVTKTDGKTIYTPGTTNVYTVVVRNLGPFTATDAVVEDLVPTGVPAANVTYTAVASAGSVTTVSGTQTGAINDLVDIQPNGTITYTITLLVPITYSGSLTNTVTVTPGENTIDPDLSNNTATDIDVGTVCYDDAAGGTGADTKHGITLLKRAGATNGGWPMIRKGAHTVLESNTKGFVITRMTTAEITAIVSPQEGMLVFDSSVPCLKIYSDGIWRCFSTASCP